MRLFFTLGMLALVGCGKTTSTPEAAVERRFPVTTVTVTEQDLTPVVIAPGSLLPDEVVRVPALVGGTVTRVLVREGDAVLLCDSLVKVEEVVRETLLQKVKEDSRRFRRLIGMSGTPSFERPRLNGAPVAGAEVATFQRRLIQIYSMLSDTETRLEKSSNNDRRKLVTNTIEWFIFSGLPLEFATTTDGSLMGEYITCLLYTSPSPRD